VSPAFWNVYREHFPAVADLLTVNFEARSITGTPVEQAFSLTATQIRANQSADTNAKNMNHASSIRGAIIREMREFKDSHDANNKRRRKHLLRSAKNQNMHLKSLRSYGLKLAEVVKIDGHIKVPTVAQMRLHGKKVMELKQSLPHTRAEMIANAPKGVIKVSGVALVGSIKASTEAKIQGWDNKPEAEKDLYEEAAKKMKSTELRKKLLSYFESNYEMCSRIGKMPKGESG
jgi:hypothetical protein